MHHTLTRSRFVALLTVLIVLFLTLQITYILRLPLVMDEFQGAGLLNRLTETVPYRDFRPYKTVLGYYLQIPALEWRSDLWQGLMNVKIQMAVMTAAALALASVHLRRHFRGAAILLALGLTVVMSTLLERGADLRVDTLTALFGFGSLLLLMDRRFIWGGIACAVSFLVSQKGVYYVLASNAALGLFWLLVRRNYNVFRDILVFNAAAAATFLVYLSFWSVIAGPQSVIQATFFSHGQIALGADYDIQLRYWIQTLSRNPLFYGLGALAFWRLEQRRKHQRPGYLEALLLVYGLVLVAFCAWHKQPWPYFFVILIPTVFVLLVYFFDSELETRRLSGMRLRWPAVAIYGLLGIAYPLTRVPVNLTRDSGFQRHMVLLADEILDKDDSYLAAVDILYNRRQGVAELAWIDKPRYLALSQMTSNELTPILEQLERAPLKLVFNTYRIKALPEPVHKSLRRGFQRLWGCLYVYSPVVRPEVQQLNIKFEGRYRLESPEPALVWIADRQLRTGETIELEPGLHSVRAQTEFRMTLLPGGIAPLLDPRYRFPQVFFPNVYDY